MPTASVLHKRQFLRRSTVTLHHAFKPLKLSPWPRVYVHAGVCMYVSNDEALNGQEVSMHVYVHAEVCVCVCVCMYVCMYVCDKRMRLFMA
jgi:hypothetical protein